MYRKNIFLLSCFLVIALLLTSCSSKSAKMDTSNSNQLKMESRSSNAVAGQAVAFDMQQEIPFNTESYGTVDENPFKNTKSEPLSTFSVDVDTASYANMRRFLNSRQQPPKDAIRIEEMVNYFGYKYPEPTGSDPFSIYMEMGKCPWNEKHDLVLLGLKGREVNVDNIPGGNLVFLIDSSGSMEQENKLPLLKSSFKILVEKLRPQDRIAIVTYAGSAGLKLGSTAGDKKDKIIKAIEGLEAGGSTAGGQGIELAYKIAKENFIKNGNNRVILATDGDFNIGPSSDAAMQRLIEEKRKDGIFLSVLGFGTGNLKDSKMETLADKGNGNYAYIDNITEAKKVLGQQIWGTLYTIAKDVKIQVDFNPSKIKGYRLIGYENRLLSKEDFNDDKKDAGDIGSGHTVTALYEIIPAGSDEEVAAVVNSEYQKSETQSSDNMMTINLRYKDPDKDESKLIKRNIKELEIRKTSMSDNYIFASAVAEFGLILRDSQYKANSSFEHVLQSAKDSIGKDENGFRKEFVQLVEKAKQLKDSK